MVGGTAMDRKLPSQDSVESTIEETVTEVASAHVQPPEASSPSDNRDPNEEPPAAFDDIPFDDQMHGGEAYNEEDEDTGPAMPEVAPSDVSAMLVSVKAKDTTPAVKAISLARMQAKDWPSVAAQLPLSGWAAQLARQSEWIGVTDQCINLRVAIRSADDSHAKVRLTTVLSEYFAEVLRVQIEYGDTGSETAHAVEQAQRAERQQRAEASAQTDPFITALMHEFDAKLIPGSVRANHHKAA